MHQNFPLYAALRSPNSPLVTRAARLAVESIRKTLGLPTLAETAAVLRRRPVPPGGLVAMSSAITTGCAPPRRTRK